MKSSINNWFANFGTNVLMKYKYPLFVVYILLMIFSIQGLKKIVMDNSYRSLLDKDDPISMNNQVFNNLYGNPDYIFILVEAEDVSKTKVLKYLRTVGEEIEEKVPFIKNYRGLTQIEYISVKGDELIVEDLIGDEIPTNDTILSQLKKKIQSKEIYLNRIVNNECTQTGMLLRFNVLPDTVYVPKHTSANQPAGIYYANQVLEHKPGEEELHNYKVIKDPKILLTPVVEHILEKNKSEFQTTVTGAVVSNYYIMQTLLSETGRTFAITLVIAIFLLFFLYRSFAAVFAPVLTIFSSIILTFGIIGWLGIVVSTFALVVALLLLVISIGYSIHIINHFRAEFFISGNRKAAIRNAYEHSGWPCFISAITSIIGFISFVMVDMVPVRNMGISCALGVFVAFTLIIFLIPAFLSFGKNKVITQTHRPAQQIEKGNTFMRKWAIATIKNFRISSIITAVLLIVCTVFVFKIEADSNYINLFGEKNKFVRDAIHSTENIGSLYSYEVMIELPEEEMAKSPEVLKKFEELNTLIQSYETTKISSSLNDLIKDINKTMHDNDPAYYKIPDSRELIAQYLLLYEISGGGELESWVDFSYQNLRNSVRVNDSPTDLIYTFRDIKSFIKENFPEGTDVKIAGDMAIVLRAVSALVEGQIMSIMLAFIGICIMMMISLRSVKGGLLSMIPNIVPLFFIMGFMGYSGITLNIQSMVVAPLILGIAVDDTVHYFLHFKSEFKIYKNYKKANEETFAKVGWALVNTSIILVIGFIPFCFSIVDGLVHLALLTIIGVIVALLGDLLITPALFVLIKPFGKESEKPELIENKLNTNKQIKKEICTESELVN